MSTVIHEHTRKSDLFRPAGAVIASWDDVEAATFGKPYVLHRIAGITTNSIFNAKKRGYFPELLARRIHDATNQRVPLIPYEQTQSGQRLKDQESYVIQARSL